MNERELEQGIRELNQDILEVERLMEKRRQRTTDFLRNQEQRLETLQEMYTKLRILDERLKMVERNRELGCDAEQRRKFLEDQLPRPAYRVTVSKNGDVYQG